MVGELIMRDYNTFTKQPKAFIENDDPNPDNECDRINKEIMLDFFLFAFILLFFILIVCTYIFWS